MCLQLLVVFLQWTSVRYAVWQLMMRRWWPQKSTSHKGNKGTRGTYIFDNKIYSVWSVIFECLGRFLHNISILQYWISFPLQFIPTEKKYQEKKIPQSYPSRSISHYSSPYISFKDIIILISSRHYECLEKQIWYYIMPILHFNHPF